MRFGANAALVAIGGVSVAYIARDAWSAARYDVVSFSPSVGTQRVGILAVIGVTAGFLAAELAREASRARAARTEAVRHSATLEVVADAARLMTSLERADVLRNLSAAAHRLGFSRVGVATFNGVTWAAEPTATVPASDNVMELIAERLGREAADVDRAISVGPDHVARVVHESDLGAAVVVPIRGDGDVVGSLAVAGVVSDELLGAENLVKDEHMRRVLADTGLDSFLFDMGIELAETAIELFADLSPDNPFFEQLNFMSADEMEEYPLILSRISRGEFDKANETARQKLLLLSFRYTEPRNRLGLLKDDEEALILKARRQFQADLPDSLRSKINFYDKDAYNAVSSIQDNILLGRIAYGYSEVTEQVQKEIHLMLEELGLKDDVFRAGLQFNIGSAGKRLTEPQRQKIALARTLLKQPDLLIVNKGLNSLDARTQERLVGRLVELARGAQGRAPFGLFWALMTPALAEKFDRVVVFENGAIVEDGVPQEVKEANGAYTALVS